MCSNVLTVHGACTVYCIHISMGIIQTKYLVQTANNTSYSALAYLYCNADIY